MQKKMTSGLISMCIKLYGEHSAIAYSRIEFICIVPKSTKFLTQRNVL